MYESFIDIISNHFVLGQGFGIPFWRNEFDSSLDSFTTDISFLAFFLPMGVIGFTLFICWIISLYKIFKERLYYKFNILINKNEIINGYRYIFIISIITSLNLDIFSRNIYILIFTLVSTMNIPDKRYK